MYFPEFCTYSVDNDPLLGCVSHSVYVRDTSQSSSSKKAGLSTSIIIIIVVAGVVVGNTSIDGTV